jgi:prophage regulatory protein
MDQPDRILRWRELRLRVNLSRSTVWRLVRAGRFPAPIPLSSAAAVGWSSKEVDEWIDARARSRSAAVESSAAVGVR